MPETTCLDARQKGINRHALDLAIDWEPGDPELVALMQNML
jgi:hypothetical protein